MPRLGGSAPLSSSPASHSSSSALTTAAASMPGQQFGVAAAAIGLDPVREIAARFQFAETDDADVRHYAAQRRRDLDRVRLAGVVVVLHDGDPLLAGEPAA